MATIEELNAKYGKPAVNVNVPVGSSLADAWGTTEEQQSPVTTKKGLGVGIGPGVAPLDLSKPILNKGVEMVKNIGGSMKDQFNEATKTYSDYLEKPNKNVGDVVSTGANLAKNVSGIVASPLGEIYNQTLGKIITPVADVLGNTPEVQAFTDFMSRYPKLSGTLADLLTTGANVAAIETAPSMVKGVVENTPKVVENIKGKTQTFKDTTGNVIDKTKSVFKGKTPEQILATPESEVGKLSSADRKYYMDNQKAQLEQKYATEKANIEQKHADIESSIKQELKTKSEASLKETKDLASEVDKAAYDKTIELKLKTKEALSRQSQTYRRMLDEEIAPYKDVPVKHSEISSKIDTTFADNPAVAENIKTKLGLTEDGTMTVEELNTKMKDLRQDIGSAGRRGTRVYNPDEVNIDKSLNSMSEILSEKGVDLSGSNKFWREWAPLRDKIITKIKPFDAAGYDTQTFSNILKKSASGDIHSQNFVKAIEDTIGEKITKETKIAIDKLDAAKKQQLANKLDAEIKLAESKAQEMAAKEKVSSTKETAKSELEVKQLLAERVAKRKMIVKRVLQGLGLWLGAKATGLDKALIQTVL